MLHMWHCTALGPHLAFGGKELTEIPFDSYNIASICQGVFNAQWRGDFHAPNEMSNNRALPAVLITPYATGQDDPDRTLQTSLS